MTFFFHNRVSKSAFDAENWSLIRWGGSCGRLPGPDDHIVIPHKADMEFMSEESRIMDAMNMTFEGPQSK